MELLQVHDLRKYYNGLKAVDGISFSVEAGEIVGLLGPNGAGKTTTLRSIIGLLRLNGGKILISDHPHTDREARRLLALVPETPDIYDMLTVWEHLKFISIAYSLLKGWEEEATKLLERFDLLEKRDELGLSLSKGMCQKLIICCALLHHPQILLLDEPLAGLDPKAARELKDELQLLKAQGKALLISTHMLDTAERFCDRVLVLKEGHLVAEGTLGELQQQVSAGANATLEDVFLELTR